MAWYITGHRGGRIRYCVQHIYGQTITRLGDWDTGYSRRWPLCDNDTFVGHGTFAQQRPSSPP